ncbi:MAG: exopolysaccharide transport family protein [Aquamicrobium sp.]|uniref:GumC family protein n=1 Tax=Aquamicrobium sp. TaxID=1872579 RepID=UPI00349E4B9C|nr:exopolysaccharide transport family protein [Aquamicrobium sp.]
MPDARHVVSDVDVDLGQLFGSLARNWLRILIAALVVTGLAYVLVGLATPLYRAETRLMIEARESPYTGPASNGVVDVDRARLDQEMVASQVEVIGSADILRTVARQLDLGSHAEFGASGETSALGNLLILAGLKSDPTQASVEERVLKALEEKLRIYRVEGSRVIVVSFSSQSPELAAAVPNAIAEAYVAAQEQAKRQTSADASQWLEPNIEQLRQRVREAEARVADYRASSGLLVGQNNSVLPTQELAEISSELTRARAERSTAEAKAVTIREALNSGESAETMPEVLASPMVQRLRERQAQIETELADLSASLLENHPRMRALRAQLDESGRQLRAEVRKVLASAENGAEAARAREQRLVVEVNRLKAASAQAGDDEVELRELEREALAQRALLETYLARYREAAGRADSASLPADARILDAAQPPHEAYFPKMVPILAAAFAGSLLVIAVIVLLRELFSGRAMRPAAGSLVRVEEDPAMEPAPAPVPTLAAREHEAEIALPEPAEWTPPVEPAHAASLPDEPAVEDVDDETRFADADADRIEEDQTTMASTRPEEITVAGIADHLIDGDAGRAVFISPEGDEATAVSVMVARELADAGLKTLYLDLTWSGAPSAAMLDSARHPGITDLLAGQAQFADIIHGDLYSACHVTPAGTADPVKAMRAADRLPMILDALDGTYDIVVIECGATDAQTIEAVADDYAEVLIGAVDPLDPAVAATVADVEACGYGLALTVTPAGRPSRGRRRRGAAA